MAYPDGDSNEMGTGTGMSPGGLAALVSTEGVRSRPDHGHPSGEQ